jgi:hypothetical protein
MSKRSVKKVLTGALVTCLIAICMVVYAAQLNRFFYTEFSPFYDSNGYSLKLLTVLELAQNESLSSALEYASKASGPAALPFIVGAFVAPFIQSPSRSLTPFLQLPWLMALTISLFLYFHIFRQKAVFPSIALTLPFIGISAVWQYNGGLSDFRLDLLLYILLGTTFVWYLSGRYTSSYWPWVLSGIFLGITCLARVTAPIYALICLVPPIFLRFLLKKPSCWRIVFGSLIVISITLLISAWFYILNFEVFYHYYFVWNTDANAQLPLKDSIKHLNIAFGNIGNYSFLIALSFFFLGLLKHLPLRKLSPKLLKQFVSQLDWESLWLGAAPIIFLVLRGAGLNPFVVMPAAFGLLMFLVSPFLISSIQENISYRKPGTLQGDISQSVVCVVACVIFLFSALRGVENHLSPLSPFQGKLFPSMRPQQALIETVDRDLRHSEHVEKAVMASTYISLINDTSLENILRFDYPELDSTIAFPVLSYPPQSFNRIQSAADWEATPGTNDDEKINYLVEQANQNLDYIILPDDASIENIRSKHPHVIVNRHIGEIKKRLIQSGEWIAVGPLQKVDHDEEVQIYRNEREPLLRK